MSKFFKSYNFRKNFILLVIIILSILFYRVTEDLKVINVFPIVFGVLSPFICGIIIAYLLNAPVRYLENKVLAKIPKLSDGFRKKLSIFIAVVFVIGAVIWIIAYIVPEILQSVQKIVARIMETDYNDLQRHMEKIAKKYNIEISKETYSFIMTKIEGLVSALLDGLKYIPDMVSSVLDYTMSIAKALYNIIMGLVIAIYLLFDKKMFLYTGKKILYIFFSHNTVKNIVKFVKESNMVFEKFFVGKFIDSLIIGVIFFVGGLILDLPYLMFLSLIIGVTNMIPYFGPFIGAVPVIVLVIFTSPVKALWVLIFIILLQQFDGIILGPKILGDSIGLKPIGVIFSIIVGGAVAGPLGMFFGVPIFAAILTLINEFLDIVYDKKMKEVSEESGKEAT